MENSKSDNCELSPKQCENLLKGILDLPPSVTKDDIDAVMKSGVGEIDPGEYNRMNLGLSENATEDEITAAQRKHFLKTLRRTFGLSEDTPEKEIIDGFKKHCAKLKEQSS